MEGGAGWKCKERWLFKTPTCRRNSGSNFASAFTSATSSSTTTIANFERALRLSPIDPMNFNNYVGIGSVHEVAQEYAEAAAFYRRALEERPNARWIYRNLASVLSGAGRVDEAKQAFAEMMRSYPDLTISKFKQAMVFSPAVRTVWRKISGSSD